MRFLRQLFCIALLGFSAACTTANLEALREVEQPQDPYLAALSAHYLAFSESEAEQYDWFSVQHFAHKGLQAAYGKDFEPEPVAPWGPPFEKQPELEQARATLLNILQSDKRKTSPQQMADLQFYFDCWVEQQAENWQHQDIAHCRNGFRAALERLANPAATRPSPPTETPTATKKVETAADIALSTSYLLFFGWNEAQLNVKAGKIINQVKHYIASLKQGYDIVLNGHTDSSGSGMINMELSHKRAQAVKNALVSQGIKADRISIFAFGESDLRVKTKDGVREPANRRVEIFIE